VVVSTPKYRFVRRHLSLLPGPAAIRINIGFLAFLSTVVISYGLLTQFPNIYGAVYFAVLSILLLDYLVIIRKQQVSTPKYDFIVESQPINTASRPEEEKRKKAHPKVKDK